MAHANLIRKQFLVSEDNVQKLEKLASSKGTSAANIVRQAIDAYDPQGETNDIEIPGLMDLVAETLKEALSATKKTNRKVANTLKLLDTEKT